ncbi:MAG: hypothetical protein EBV03_06270 [Proteobacteria bacterium]|nr:hypothetical protein [Pseudomonadota bacterium]
MNENTEKNAANPLGFLASILPGGAVEQAHAAEAQAKLYDPKDAHAMGDAIWKVTLGGLGAGLTGSRLYHLVSEMNRPKPKYTKFGPGSKKIDDEEKIASLWKTVVSAPGTLIQNLTTDPVNREALRDTAMLLGGAGATYAGASAMNAIVNKKRKEDLQEQVEDAKKEYMRALLGSKRAEALDAAFDNMQKSASEKAADADGLLAFALNAPFDAAKAISPKFYKAYVLTTLGLAPLAGKMTYDWTRARSRDKAIAEAQKARARLVGPPPIHVDPDQMAALKQIASND